MKSAAFFPAAALLALAAPAAAQFGPVQAPSGQTQEQVQAPPSTWASAWLGGLISPGRIYDPASGSNWDFGSSVSAGLGLHRSVGRSLVIGLEGSFAPATFERRDPAAEDVVIDEGSARLMTAMLTGRLRTGGGGSFGMYLTGGAGALIYGMPSLGRWDPDLALLTGAGLEYKPSPKHALFVEWGRYWTFHQREGVKDNSARMSQLRGGIRIGL